MRHTKCGFVQLTTPRLWWDADWKQYPKSCDILLNLMFANQFDLARGDVLTGMLIDSGFVFLISVFNWII
jgi:hypothetical protein